MNTELSIIIPSFNTAKYIAEAVLSAAQDIPDSEIIVVDDASTDNTTDVLRSLKLPNLQVVELAENSPGGAGHPSNIGIEKASGEYLAFVDSDDFFRRGYLRNMLDEIKASKTDICVSDYRMIDTVTHAERVSHDFKSWRQVTKSSLAGQIKKEEYFTLSPEPWRKVYHRSLFINRRVRFPTNGWFNEDYPFHWFVGLQSQRGISYVNSDNYFHRVNRIGQTTACLDERSFFLFDHTEEILSFMASNANYQGYEGLLLNWLVVGAWKLERVSVNLEEYFHRYQTLLRWFDAKAVEQFNAVAEARHKYAYKRIISAKVSSDVTDIFS
jgi:glycosyltransferase involved in cell wall biosynthesis